MSVDPPLVMLLESDPNLRRLLAGALQRRGHAVVEASSGNDVVQQVVESFIYERPRAPPSLVIAELQSHSGSGLSIPQTMRVVRYDVPVLLMATFPEPAIEASAARIPGCQLIAKPFDVFEFLQTARAMIDSTRLKRPLRRSS